MKNGYFSTSGSKNTHCIALFDDLRATSQALMFFTRFSAVSTCFIRALIDTMIRDILYMELPASYSDEAIVEYREQIYDYVLKAYPAA